VSTGRTFPTGVGAPILLEHTKITRRVRPLQRHPHVSSIARPHRTLQLVIRHTDDQREYAYDNDPILNSGTGQILTTAAEHGWTVIDMATDWSTVHPTDPAS
jgi:hypothetical protein